MKNLKNELNQMKLDLDIIQKQYCSNEEKKAFNKLKKDKQPLPEGIFENDINDFYRIIEADLSHEEIQELLLYKQVAYLKTIKNSVLFFVVLTLISIVGTYIFLNMR